MRDRIALFPKANGSKAVCPAFFTLSDFQPLRVRLPDPVHFAPASVEGPCFAEQLALGGPMIWWIVLFGAFVGCAPEPAAVQPEAAHAPRASVVPLLKGELAPTSMPGLYDVKLRWEIEDGFYEQVWIKRTLAGSKEVMAQLPPESRQWTDTGLTSGSHPRYEIVLLSDALLTSMSEVQVNIPLDWVVEAGVHAPPSTSYGRIFLREGAVIRTHGQLLEWDLLELHSDGGRIETYPEAAVASPGIPGGPGSTVSIKAQFASGHLTVNASGMKGGQGSPGAKGPTGDGGTPFVNLPGSHQDLQARDGSPGGPGTAGGQGFSGGDGGAVMIDVARAADFLPFVTSAGGEGGEGGPGGPGGDGGSAGWTPRDFAHSPQPGPIGSAGPAGLVGLPGKAGAVSIKLNGNHLFSVE